MTQFNPTIRVCRVNGKVNNIGWAVLEDPGFIIDEEPMFEDDGFWDEEAWEEPEPITCDDCNGMGYFYDKDEDYFETECGTCYGAGYCYE
jgi:hypothetical protein